MDPVKFPQQTNTLDHDDDYKSLPICELNDKNGRVITCWKMTDEQFEVFSKNRLIWVEMHTFEDHPQPIRLDVTPPFIDPGSHN